MADQPDLRVKHQNQTIKILTSSSQKHSDMKMTLSILEIRLKSLITRKVITIPANIFKLNKTEML